MISTATEMKNNFGYYLKHVTDENGEVTITKNNQKVAQLVPFSEEKEKVFRFGNTTPEYTLEKKSVTYDEFTALFEKAGNRMEYINGEVFLMSLSDVSHQVILSDLTFIFSQYFKGKGCKPFCSPFIVNIKKFDSDVPDVMQPDLVVICDLEDNLNKKNRYTGTPKLVLEVVSEGTRSNDMVLKLNSYLASGTSEYWIVDPRNKSILIYLFEDHNIAQFTQYRMGEVASSVTFEGLGADVTELFSGMS